MSELSDTDLLYDEPLDSTQVAAFIALQLSRFQEAFSACSTELLDNNSRRMPGPAVPPGYHPPLAVATDNDHSAWIIISASLGIVYSVVFGAIRTFLRYTSGGFGADDAILAVSTVSFHQFSPLVCPLVVYSACSLDDVLTSHDLHRGLASSSRLSCLVHVSRVWADRPKISSLETWKPFSRSVQFYPGRPFFGIPYCAAVDDVL